MLLTHDYHVDDYDDDDDDDEKDEEKRNLFKKITNMGNEKP